jgi:hypothetical protein
MKLLLFLASAACLGYTLLPSEKPGGTPSVPSRTFVLPAGTTIVRHLAGSPDVPTVVQKAQALKALLSPSQISTLQQTYTPALSHRWSNLPCGSSCRNGIHFSSHTSTDVS